MSAMTELVKGVYRENPVFRLALGLCPALAVSTSVENALGMGAAATFVLLGSNIVISLVRKAIPAKVRIPCFIVVIATFVVIVELVMKAFMFQLSQSLGIFIPLIVVNCIILGRAEAFAAKNPPHLAAADGLGVGLGFTLSLTILGAVREVLGKGTFLGASVFGDAFEPFGLMAEAPGAFIGLGMLLFIMNAFDRYRSRVVKTA